MKEDGSYGFDLSEISTPLVRDAYLRFEKIPDNCRDCPCSEYYGEVEEFFECEAESRSVTENEFLLKRPEWCPILEFPHHIPVTAEQDMFDKGFAHGFNKCLNKVKGWET